MALPERLTRRLETVKWPEGRRAGAAITFDVDGTSGWIAADERNAKRPGMLSQGRYGPEVGLPLVLELLDRIGITSTFFVPGVVAEAYHEIVEDTVACGHELALHGYTHRPPAQLSRDEETEELVRALEVCRSIDPAVCGYRSPSWDISPWTLELLEGMGITYTSQFMDRFSPYRHEGHDLVELPVQWLLDDWPLFAWPRPGLAGGITSASVVEEMWVAEFEAVSDRGGLFVLTMHPQLIGRPSRVTMLERVLRRVVERGDVWVSDCRTIAAYVKEVW